MRPKFSSENVVIFVEIESLHVKLPKVNVINIYIYILMICFDNKFNVVAMLFWREGGAVLFVLLKALLRSLT